MTEMTPQDYEGLNGLINPGQGADADDAPMNGDDAQPASQSSANFSGDPRDRKHKFDIYKIDWKWVDNQTSKKELRGAYNCLKEDGGFPDLMAYTLKRLKEVDKSFKTTEDFNNATPQDIKAANDDVLDFLNQANETDQKLRGPNAKEQVAAIRGKKVNKDIFGSSGGDEEFTAPEPSKAQLDFAAELERKSTAERERYKGNEFMKSKEFNSAVECYSKSIELNKDEAATYSNRAMAYLKLKNYGATIEDANTALKLQPDYLKAFHRRGKAYLATNKFDEAIEDF